MALKILYWENFKDIQAVSNLLKDNEIILGTSDTTLGLLAQVSEPAIKKLNALKQRQTKPYLILINSTKQLNLFSDEKSIQLENVINYFWPGPLTVIVTGRKDLPSFMKTAHNTIALRVPKHEGLLSLLNNFSGLFSTSANITNQPVPETIEDVVPEIKQHVQGIIIDEYKKPGIVPSTIVDFSGPVIKVVREGLISKEELSEVLKIKL